MNREIRILVQTTTPGEEDGWSIDRLSLLREHLAGIREDGLSISVTARNRPGSPGEPDPFLSRLDEAPFDELWLFALDTGEGLAVEDCEGITRFRQRGGGILATRDHQNMGSSLCSLGGIGAAHYFQTQNPEPAADRHAPDDTGTPTISWPNYHSGRNGDFQSIRPAGPPHELLRHPGSPTGWIERFPAHPHEGAVGVPPDEEHARVVATSRSLTTGRDFNLVVAFEGANDRHGNRLGRGIAQSSFHHFADYNWDTSRGAPYFVTEPEGDGMRQDPRAADDIRRYVRNLAVWLAPTV